MKEDRIFKPFLDIPVSYDPVTNPEMIGVLSNPELFKKQLARTIGHAQLKSLLLGVGVAVGLAGVLVATGGTAFALPFGVKIVFGATGWGVASTIGVVGGTAVAGTHQGCRWLKRRCVKEVPTEVSGNIDKLACFVAATVFRKFFIEEPQHIRDKFIQWGYEGNWIDAAVCILQRNDVNVRELIRKCSTKTGLQNALKKCKLPTNAISQEVFKTICK